MLSVQDFSLDHFVLGCILSIVGLLIIIFHKLYERGATIGLLRIFHLVMAKCGQAFTLAAVSSSPMPYLL